MRNQKIISVGLVILVALTVLSTFLVATPVSATAIIGRCPEGFTLVPAGTSVDRNVDRNTDGWICESKPHRQAQSDQSYSIYIDDIAAVCNPSQVAACQVPKRPA